MSTLRGWQSVAWVLHTVIADAADAEIDWDRGEVHLDRRPTEPPGHPFE